MIPAIAPPQSSKDVEPYISLFEGAELGVSTSDGAKFFILSSFVETKWIVSGSISKNFSGKEHEPDLPDAIISNADLYISSFNYTFWFYRYISAISTSSLSLLDDTDAPCC